MLRPSWHRSDGPSSEHVAKAEPIALISDIDTEQGSENNNPESVRNPSQERQAHRLFLFYSLGTL